jgi:hypothetical protein
MPLIRSRHRHSGFLDFVLGVILVGIGFAICGLGVADIILLSQFNMADGVAQMRGFDPQQLYFFLGVRITAEPVPQSLLTPALLRLALGGGIMWLGRRYFSGKR